MGVCIERFRLLDCVGKSYVFFHVFWFETALRCFALKSTQLFQELSQPQGSEARMVPCAAEFH